ncbi:5'_nucleotidase family protein [Hexamita inflata]|uniref:5' nucleotidase family protein n=1 Tax=Hexamita inflata TaxID=28002 RepID=A0AA86TPG0_9EUKA|nr:5' nucleotidase family protein [Hexamita inflata]
MLLLNMCLNLPELHIIQVSDIHGGIYGHKDHPELGDIGTLLSYYQRVQQNISSNPDASMLLIGTGDDCEGTGLSGLTNIQCSEIYNFLSYLPFDLMTVGNHDLSEPEAMEHLFEFQHQFKKKPFVTTNTFYNQTNELFSQPFKYQVMPNGIRVFMIGLMFSPTQNDYQNTYTKHIEETLRSKWFRGILDEYAVKSDIFLLNMHIGTMEPESHTTYKTIRALFDEFNYKIPVHVLGAHNHLVFHIICPPINGVVDKNCIATECGQMLKNLQHVVWTLAPQNVTTPVGINFTGSTAVSVVPFEFDKMIVAPTQAGEGLAARFNISPDQFDTPDALELRKLVQAKIDQMNLYQVIGHSKFSYVYAKGMYFNDSFQRLWNQALMPALVYNPELQKKCYQFPITRVDNTFRRDLVQGNITLDDAMRTVPFSFNTTYLPNIEPKKAQCLYFWGNLARWNHDHDVISIETFQELFQKYKQITDDDAAMVVPFYSVNNNTWEGPCYDMITTNYEQKRLIMGYKYCGITGHEPEVYPTSSGIQLTDELFIEFIKRYFNQNEEDEELENENEQKIVVSFTVITSALWLLGIIAIAFFAFK